MVCSDNGLRATTREPDGDHEMVLCVPAVLLPLELTLRMPDDQGFEDALEFHARDGRATSGVGWSAYGADNTRTKNATLQLIALQLLNLRN